MPFTFFLYYKIFLCLWFVIKCWIPTDYICSGTEDVIFYSFLWYYIIIIIISIIFILFILVYHWFVCFRFIIFSVANTYKKDKMLCSIETCNVAITLANENGSLCRHFFFFHYHNKPFSQWNLFILYYVIVYVYLTYFQQDQKIVVTFSLI